MFLFALALLEIWSKADGLPGYEFKKCNTEVAKMYPPLSLQYNAAIEKCPTHDVDFFTAVKDEIFRD